MRRLLSILLLFPLCSYAQGPAMFFRNSMHQVPVTTPPSANLFAYYESDQGITESLGIVSQWDDLSGNGNDLVQATLNNRPSISGDEVIFDYNTYPQHLAKTGISVAQPFTVFAVVSFTSDPWAAACYFRNVTGSATFNAAFSTVFWPAADQVYAANQSAIFSTDAISQSTYYLIKTEFNSDASVLQINEGTEDDFGDPNSYTLDDMRIGEYNTAPMIVKVKALYVYVGAVSADDVRAYINNKYAVY